MTRIQLVYNELSEILKRCETVPAVYTHLVEVSQICALIALRRGENAELSTIAGALHDVTYLCLSDNEKKYSGFQGGGHAEDSALIASRMLSDMKVFSAEEIEKVCLAIHNHANKTEIGTPLEEIVKDSDVFSHGLYDITSGNFRGDRWDQLCEEFSLTNPRLTE